MRHRKIIMKGKLLVILFFVLSTVGCRNKKETALYKEIISSSTVTLINTEICNIKNKHIAKVIENKSTYYNTELRKNLFLKDYSSTNYMVQNGDRKYKYVYDKSDCDKTLEIKRWSESDIDMDDESEVLIEFNNSNILVLDNMGNTVYSYVFPYRGMNSIKKDGSFQQSDSASSVKIGKVNFVKGECFYNEMCVSDELDEEKPIYRLNKKDCDKESVKSFLKKQEKKENILWFNGNP